VSEKGGRRRQALKDTWERHSKMKCSVFRLTIDASRLSKKDYLERLFFEKKWFRNAVIDSQEIYAFDYKTKTAKVRN
jgi:hypothetical protein